MIHRKVVRRASKPGLAAGLTLLGGVVLAMSGGGCSAVNNAQQASQGCDEFSGGDTSIAALQVDSTTKAFLTATSDFASLVNSMETATYTACNNIDKDLGVTDTWSSITTGLDDQVNAACTAASAKIQSILNGDGGAQADCALSISGGQCTVDTSVEASCEASCSGMASCTPPDVTVSCQPGDLSVECNGTCNAGAVCEGTVTAPVVMCTGSCSADCSGECDAQANVAVQCNGTCSGNCQGTCNGTASSGACSGTCVGKCDAACTYASNVKAHCSGTCKGGCTGDCTVAGGANVMCGAMVRCKGGCTGTATLPQCEGEVTPAMCTSNVNCQSSCQAHAELKAMCTPPSASLDCQASASPDITALVATLSTNLPAILNVVQVQGPLAVKAAAHVATTGAAVVGAVTTLSGKAAACATTAFAAIKAPTASLTVTVSVSASVSTSCGGPGSA